jgi:hypothetical protein
MEAPHQYENVPAHQDECDESSTEVDESLMGEESQWHEKGIPGLARRSKKSSLRQRLGTYRWIIDTSLLLVILALIVRDQLRQPPLNPWDFNGDLTGFGPRCML